MLVAEKRSGESEVGAGLQLSPNASHILGRWGLGEMLAPLAVAPTSLAIHRWEAARPFAEMPFALAADGAPFWVMLRADLHEGLRGAALAAGVTIREGLALESLRDDGAALTIRFRSSAELTDVTSLCLIGADGNRSAARRLLGDARDLDEPGWQAWRTLVPAEKAPPQALAPTTHLWLGRTSHGVHYPVAGGRLVNLVVIRRSSARTEGWAREGDPKALSALVASAAPPLSDLMRAAPSWAVWTLRDRAPSPWLAKGAACLVGDAAHPLLPFLAQGAALAIEDAETLAQALPPPERFERPLIEAGLKAYAEARAARTQAVFKAARANAFAYHLPEPLAWLRDRRIAALGPDGMRQRYSWLYDWRTPAQGM